MRKISTIFTIVLSVVALLTACKSNEPGPLLKGTAKFTDPDTEFFINFKADGNMLTAVATELTPDSLGNFEFDAELLADAADCEIYVGNDIYGVHLERGKTLILNIVQTADGKFACSFAGDNAALSEVMSAAFAAYDLYTYSGQSNEEASADEFLQRLDRAHAGVQAKLDLICDDDEQHEFYTQLTQAMYLGTKARIIEDKAGAEGKDAKDYPEYMEIINSIDPNADIAFLSGNCYLWISNQMKNKVGADMLTISLENMDIVEQHITNPQVRKAEIYLIGHQFFTYGDHETGKEEFWARYCEFAKDYPEYIEALKPEYERVVVNATGAEMPDIELKKPDGTTVALSTLRGKYTYVDVWATWCGPCCKEIPHLEKLVEKMTDQTRVQFVSLSVDTDEAAWHNKLANDNPVWPQFILSAEANKTLSQTLNITGIPRFFILDPDGRILDPDSKRPSNPDLEAELRAL